MTVTRKKLIEVALPLDVINTASVRENYIYRGNPSSLHKWWSQKPLATARAVIFAQMVDDPSEYIDEILSDPTKRQIAERTYRARAKSWEDRRAEFERAHAKGMTGASNPEPGSQPTLEETVAALERQRLFEILEELVQWENNNNEVVLQRAREEIWRSWRRACAENNGDLYEHELFDQQKLPALYDPFAGGGTLPLEAQRLGLESYASDLNPVAVLINKAMIDIPVKFSGQPPINPLGRKERLLIAREWRGVMGLAEDVRYYGEWIRKKAKKRIGYLYPDVQVTAEVAVGRPDLRSSIGQKLPVIAWLWTRTVKSPNPAFSQVAVPLTTTFMLSTKKGKEVYVEPIIENGDYRFTIKLGDPKDSEITKHGTKSGSSGSSFLCLMSGTPMPFEYLRSEAKAGRMGMRLLAIVAESDHGRVYLPPTKEIENLALSAQPENVPDTDLPEKALGFRIQEYGMTHWCDLFTHRQLVALTTLSDLVQEVREQVKNDALELADDNNWLKHSNFRFGQILTE